MDVFSWFCHKIGCHGNVPLAIAEWMSGLSCSPNIYQPWKFGEDWSSIFWDYMVVVGLLKNKEKNISRTYSLVGKHAEQAKLVVCFQWWLKEMPPPMAISVLSKDQVILKTKEDDRLPMTSYLHLMLIMAPSHLIFEILTFYVFLS